MISNVDFSQVPACVTGVISTANTCYPCVCGAVEWISGVNVCGTSTTIRGATGATRSPKPGKTQNWFSILGNLGTRHLFSYLWLEPGFNLFFFLQATLQMTSNDQILRGWSRLLNTPHHPWQDGLWMEANLNTKAIFKKCVLSCSRHRTTKFPNSESPIFCLLAWSNSRARHSAIYVLKSRNLF